MEKRYEVGPQGQLRLDSVTITIGLLTALAGWLGHFFVLFMNPSSIPSLERFLSEKDIIHSVKSKGNRI